MGRGQQSTAWEWGLGQSAAWACELARDAVRQPGSAHAWRAPRCFAAGCCTDELGCFASPCSGREPSASLPGAAGMNWGGPPPGAAGMGLGVAQPSVAGLGFGALAQPSVGGMIRCCPSPSSLQEAAILLVKAAAAVDAVTQGLQGLQGSSHLPGQSLSGLRCTVQRHVASSPLVWVRWGNRGWGSRGWGSRA